MERRAASVINARDISHLTDFLDAPGYCIEFLKLSAYFDTTMRCLDSNVSHVDCDFGYIFPRYVNPMCSKRCA